VADDDRVPFAFDGEIQRAHVEHLRADELEAGVVPEDRRQRMANDSCTSDAKKRILACQPQGACS
jgi:hypothetical protein